MVLLAGLAVWLVESDRWLVLGVCLVCLLVVLFGDLFCGYLFLVVWILISVGGDCLVVMISVCV